MLTFLFFGLFPKELGDPGFNCKSWISSRKTGSNVQTELQYKSVGALALFTLILTRSKVRRHVGTRTFSSKAMFLAANPSRAYRISAEIDVLALLYRLYRYLVPESRIKQSKAKIIGAWENMTALDQWPMTMQIPNPNADPTKPQFFCLQSFFCIITCDSYCYSSNLILCIRIYVQSQEKKYRDHAQYQM